MATSIDELFTARLQEDPGPGNRDYRVGQGAARFRLLLMNRHERIQKAAYFKAARRGFSPGCELDDWLEAEREVDDLARLVV